MSEYGPTSSLDFSFVDTERPGAPTIVNVFQTSNTTAEVVLIMPTTDANGSGVLSGLTAVAVAVAKYVDGINPLANMSMQDIIASNDPAITYVVTPVSESKAGQEVTILVEGFTQFGEYTVVAAATDQ